VRPSLRSTALVFQEPESVGVLEVMTSPSELSALSIATQRLLVGHDTPVRLATQSSPAPFLPHSEGVDVGTVTVVHAPGPPAGSVEISRVPLAPAATHSDTAGHDTLERSSVLAANAFHADRPPVGSVEVTTSLPPTNTHSDLEGHDNEAGSAEVLLIGLVTRFQLGDRAPASVEVKMSGPPATTQSVAEAHDTALNPPTEEVAVPSINCGACHTSGPEAHAAGTQKSTTIPAANTATPLRQADLSSRPITPTNDERSPK
jgi:hypothetical protein